MLLGSQPAAGLPFFVLMCVSHNALEVLKSFTVAKPDIFP